MSQSSVSAHEATIKELEQRATTAEQAVETAQKEIETLKETIHKPVETEKNDAEDPAALQAKITTLESDLRTAQSSADTATSRAGSLEQKIETLTKLHKDQTNTHDTQIKDLTSKLALLKTSQTPAANDTDSIADDANDLEREQLHQRIRSLEAENTDLRRGVWRDQRAALQPDINDASPGYEDVDLSNPYAAPSSSQRPHARTGSSFQDVLQSGINAFTGGQRKQSLGLLSEEDLEFDEDSFRIAQEEEGKKRIERIREVKRGLEGWRGWRVDLVDVRAGGLGGGAATGPMFEVCPHVRLSRLFFLPLVPPSLFLSAFSSTLLISPLMSFSPPCSSFLSPSNTPSPNSTVLPCPLLTLNLTFGLLPSRNCNPNTTTKLGSSGSPQTIFSFKMLGW